jgi:hypothetical protein
MTSYLGVVLDEPVIAPSALKHGLSKEEILHAYMILEVGYIDGDTAVVIVHAMHVREKFLR